MHHARFPIWGVVFGVLSCAGGNMAAEQEAADVLAVNKAVVGFGGKFKAGFWQPLQLTVVAGPRGAHGRLEVVVPDGDQMPARFVDGASGDLNLAAGEEQTIWLYFKSGPIDAPIRVELRNDSAITWSSEIPLARPALPSTQELIVGIGPAVGLEEAVATMRRRADGIVQTANIASAVELPDRWWAYEGVDALVLATSDGNLTAALSDEQRQGIIDWVLLGGRIILCVGARGGEIAAPSSPWSRLVPGEFVEVDALRQRSGLEHFTKTELPFEADFFQRNRPAVTRLKNVRGEVLFDEINTSAERPLAIHAAAGLGQVTFVALDLDHPSLAAWKGRAKLVAAVVQRGAAERDHGELEARRGVKQLGYDDLVGQLRAALDQFPGISVVNFTTVSVLTIVYLLLIGPGDYLLLSRLNVPRQATWITFPLVAAGVIGLTGAMQQQVHGSRVRVNLAEIVDIDLANQTARGTVWTHFFSPQTREYDVAMRVAAPREVAGSAPQGWLAWQGLPGDSLGGLESRQPALVIRNSYEVKLPGVDGELGGVTVQVASSKCLAGSWWAKSELPDDSKLTLDRYGLLAGELRQPLSIDLADCLLAHGEKLYRLGSVKAGQKVQMADLPPLNLEARLTQRRVENTKDVSTPWEPDSVDIPRIMQMVMFHESARGRSYTGLTHRYQPRVDLSDHVRIGQAVLVGRAESSAVRLSISGVGAPATEPEDITSYTWYRILLPVAR